MYTVVGGFMWFQTTHLWKATKTDFNRPIFFRRNLSQKTTYRNHQVALGFTSQWCHQSDAWKRSPKSTPKMRKFCSIKNSCLPSWKRRPKVCGVGFQLPVISVDAWNFKVSCNMNPVQQSSTISSTLLWNHLHLPIIFCWHQEHRRFLRRPPSRQRPGRSWDHARSSKTKIPGKKNHHKTKDCQPLPTKTKCPQVILQTYTTHWKPNQTYTIFFDKAPRSSNKIKHHQPPATSHPTLQGQPP